MKTLASIEEVLKQADNIHSIDALSNGHFTIIMKLGPQLEISRKTLEELKQMQDVIKSLIIHG